MEFHQIIESFVQGSLSLREQGGGKFERLCVRILKIAPEFKDRFDEVLLWREFSDRYGIGQGDDGIDIMVCGTGKSLLSIRVIDSLVDSSELSLVLAPSLAPAQSAYR